MIDIILNGETHTVYDHETTEGGHLHWFEILKRGAKTVYFGNHSPYDSKPAIEFIYPGEPTDLSVGRLYLGETLKIVEGMRINVYAEKRYNEA